MLNHCLNLSVQEKTDRVAIKFYPKNSCELVTFVSSIACAISECYSKDDVAILAAVLSQLGDTLTTILTHEELCNSNDSK